MRRLALHLLLVFTLILNGISAPSAMARMSHGDHRPSGQATAPIGAPAAEHAHHGPHAMGDTVTLAAAADLAPSPVGHDRSCCNGTSCACGCVLPPALSVLARLPAVAGHAPIAFVFPAAHPMPGHDTPPFRPPAD